MSDQNDPLHMVVYRNEQRLAALEDKVELLEKARSGRRGLPILVSQKGVCGVEPERDSATCDDASLYRRQRGCKGIACMLKASEYYADYRASAAFNARQSIRDQEFEDGTIQPDGSSG